MICLLSGVAASAGGWRLVESQKTKPGNTSFVSFYSPTVLLTGLGWLLFAVGLIFICILTPMAYIAG